MDLTGILNDALGGDTVSQISQTIGADEDSTNSAIQAALPALLGGLAHQSSTDEGAEELAGALERGELEDNRVALVRVNIAFHTQQATMIPPSRELVNQIIDISKRAVEMTVERATASAVIALATSALNKFAQIQGLS